MTQHAKKAGELFMNGYNCAQAVFCAFEDVTGLDERTAILTMAGMGGGVARMREVCGTVSAMAMVLGFVYGSLTPADHEAKKALYAHIQAAAALFREKAGSIVCRDLLGSLDDGASAPAERTQEYYHHRPCRRFVELSAQTIDEYLAAHPAQKGEKL